MGAQYTPKNFNKRCRKICIILFAITSLELFIAYRANLTHNSQAKLKNVLPTIDSSTTWPTRIGPKHGLSSDLAKLISKHQNNCELKPILYNLNHAGLGSDIHVFSQIVAKHYLRGQRVVTNHGDRFVYTWNFWNWKWKWLSERHCEKGAGLHCYFDLNECSKSENQATGSKISVENPTIQTKNSTFVWNYFNTDNSGWISYEKGHQICRLNKNQCSQDRPVSIIQTVGSCSDADSKCLVDYRAGFTEYLFSQGLTEIVKTEVIRQTKFVFGSTNLPKNMITVHIRWGNKIREAQHLQADVYAEAVWKLVKLRKLTGVVSVYLATEDPLAKDLLETSLKKVLKSDSDRKNGENQPQRVTEFKIYLDATVSVYLENGLRPENIDPTKGRGFYIDIDIANKSKGLYGLQVMASLVIALESDDYVLTTTSNFSRLINEIRKNIINPRFGNRTKLIDLDTGEW